MSSAQIAPPPEHVCYVHCNFCNTILAVTPSAWYLSLFLSALSCLLPVLLRLRPLKRMQIYKERDAWNHWLWHYFRHDIANYIWRTCIGDPAGFRFSLDRNFWIPPLSFHSLPFFDLLFSRGFSGFFLSVSTLQFGLIFFKRERAGLDIVPFNWVLLHHGHERR